MFFFQVLLIFCHLTPSGYRGGFANCTVEFYPKNFNNCIREAYKTLQYNFTCQFYIFIEHRNSICWKIIFCIFLIKIQAVSEKAVAHLLRSSQPGTSSLIKFTVWCTSLCGERLKHLSQPPTRIPEPELRERCLFIILKKGSADSRRWPLSVSFSVSRAGIKSSQAYNERGDAAGLWSPRAPFYACTDNF